MIEGRRIHVRGLVQGVGFRPFVWHVATELELSGWVRNDAAGVEIAAEGDPARIGELVTRLRSEAPSHARVDAIRVDPVPARGERGFVIVTSATGAPGAAHMTIGPDTGVCAQCLEELFDPASRRWRHPFITCTHCGPRFTLTHGLPYDRARTSMARFPMCAACAREYADPGDRRFHAEPVCCVECGPRLRLHDGKGTVQVGDPIAQVLALLRSGAMVAIKGLGGFHLACDARNPQAVARLRARKERERKPFAVMGANVASFRGIARIDDAECALLESDERPVVLCAKAAPRPFARSKDGSGEGGSAGSPALVEVGAGAEPEIADGIAPGLQTIGLMLPSTPIQWLLFHEAAGQPAGTAWLARPQELLLVMTSANLGGEPLVSDNDEAAERLAGDPPIADAILDHDREILVRCDDSVRSAHGFVRRARGFVPQAIRLPRPGPSIIAFGGGYKNTVCITRGDQAYVSQHVGDLDNAATVRFLERTVDHLLGVVGVAPAAAACDLHPDFASSRMAAGFAERTGIALIPVQHHHAHIAAVLAEHGREEADAVGLAVDGVGLGTDGGIWGGELLRLQGVRCDRIAHLAPLRLPGGDRAAREPWRMAAAALHRMGLGGEIGRRFSARPGAPTIADMLVRGLHSPPTTSLGRVFDAAAALLGVCEIAAYEGEAAMRLEGLARTVPHASFRFEARGMGEGGLWRIDREGTLDLLPLLAFLADCRDPAHGAAVFHAALARALADWVVGAVERTGIRVVAGGGGCLLNSLLGTALRGHLRAEGLTFLEARQLPPNDGGLSLGQAWVAMQTVGS